jgi:hypothetical protein
MKNYWIGILTVFMLSSCAKSRLQYHENKQGNMFLRSGKVYFQKSFNSSLTAGQVNKKLTDNNTPYGGIQIKQQTEEMINGVILNHQFNWDFEEFRKTKIPKELKYPANANFDILRKGSVYEVTVNSIWFSDMNPKSKQKNITLESFVVESGGLVFKKSRTVSELLYMIDFNFNRLFVNKGFTDENRF